MAHYVPSSDGHIFPPHKWLATITSKRPMLLTPHRGIARVAWALGNSAESSTDSCSYGLMNKGWLSNHGTITRERAQRKTAELFRSLRNIRGEVAGNDREGGREGLPGLSWFLQWRCAGKRRQKMRPLVESRGLIQVKPSKGRCRTYVAPPGTY